MKTQTSNFACEFMLRDTKPKKRKIGHKGAWPRSRDLLFKFWDPLIYLERLKLQTSNFACRLTVMDTKLKNEKLSKRGRGLGHMTYFLNFGTP